MNSIKRLRFLEAVVSGVLLLISCGKWRTPETVYIPRGYIGWVRIQYSVANAPPLENKGGRLIVHVPQNGSVQTSTAMDWGLANDEYYYIDPAGAVVQLRIAENANDEKAQIRALRYITVAKLKSQEPKQG